MELQTHNSPMPLSSHRWRMKRPKGARLWCSRRLNTGCVPESSAPHQAHFIPFTAQTRMSGVDFDGRQIRKGGRLTRSKNYVTSAQSSSELQNVVERISRAGGTPLVVADNRVPIGVIHLKDIVKGGMSERFNQLRVMGIKTVDDHGR